MVYVKLERPWTDQSGTAHEAGAMVDVDAGTLATLQADGTVSDGQTDSNGWAHPDDGGDASTDSNGWAHPDGGPGA